MTCNYLGLVDRFYRERVVPLTQQDLIREGIRELPETHVAVLPDRRVVPLGDHCEAVRSHNAVVRKELGGEAPVGVLVLDPLEDADDCLFSRTPSFLEIERIDLLLRISPLGVADHNQGDIVETLHANYIVAEESLDIDGRDYTYHLNYLLALPELDREVLREGQEIVFLVVVELDYLTLVFLLLEVEVEEFGLH